MADLSTTEKQILEKLFQMGDGYVLNFSDRTMQEFFRDDMKINIYDQKYNYSTGSKANRMRGFRLKANNKIVGKSIEKLIVYIETQILLGGLNEKDFPEKLLERGKRIASKLLGKSGKEQKNTTPSEDDFLDKEFSNIDIQELDLDTDITDIIQYRITEIKAGIEHNAPLSVIFLCGSSLEGIFLGIANNSPKEFNRTSSAPKDNLGKVKKFQCRTLNDFIDVAHELGLIKEDVKKFSHYLRDFRNYIHPHQQLSTGFHPDIHTAKICWQVLQAAIHQLSQ